MRGAAVDALRQFLHLVISLSILLFLFTAVNSGSKWFLNSTPWSKKLPHGVLKLRYNALADRFGGKGRPEPILMTSDKAFKLCVLLSSSAVAAVATLCLRSLPEGPTRRGRISKSLAKVKQLLLQPVPPHQFWLEWCGGLNVLDLGVVSGVLFTAVLWIQQLTSARWQLIDDLMANGGFAEKYAGKTVAEAKLESLVVRLGFGILACAMALFYPVPRNSFLQALFKVDFSYLIKYHRWIGHLTLILTSTHGLSWYMIWLYQGRFWQQATSWQSHKIPFLAGSCAWAGGLMLWVTSFAYIRRHYFEVFYKAHMLGFVCFYVFGFLHYSGLFYYAIPGFLLYMLDLTFRLAQWMNVSMVRGDMLADNILNLELSFEPETQLRPNSFLFISIPAASRAQWHPFTLAYVRNSTHASQPAKASLHIKPYGKWSQAVAREVAKHGRVLAKVDGPYGGTSPLLDGRCKVAVVFAGGIGVTPMLGLLDSLCNHKAHVSSAVSQQPVERPNKVVFVWACREAASFQLMDRRLSAACRAQHSWLDVRLFCTSSSSKDPDANLERVPLVDHSQQKPSDGGATAHLSALHLTSSSSSSSLEEAQSYSLASPFFLKPSLLQGYGIGYGWWAVTHLLCFAGAFFAIVTAEAWGQMEQFVYDNSYTYWSVNAMRLLALFVGGMGFPVLLIFPIVLRRRRRYAKASHALLQGTEQAEDLCQEIQMESGLRPEYTHGRPDVRGILLEALGEHAGLEEIHVHVAGPHAMVKDVKQHCTSLNLMRDNQPQLSCAVDSFAL